MNFEQRCTVPVARPAVWDLMMDIERVGLCFPGLEKVTRSDDGTYTGTLRVKLGPVSLGLAGTLTVQQADRDNWQALLRIQASDRRVGGGVKSDLSLRLLELSPNETELVISSDISFLGRLGELGQPLIRKRAETTMQEFARNLERELKAE